MKEYKATQPSGGYKTYSCYRTKTCAYCGKKYKIFNNEVEYVVKIPTGVHNKKSNKVKSFCRYTCKQRYIKQNLDPSKQY